MNIEQALKIMYEGGSVESLVSNTAYNMEKLEDRFKLFAEGSPVDISYLTREEVNGEFREIFIVETQEQLDNLSEEEREKLINNTFEGIKNKRNFDESVRGLN